MTEYMKWYKSPQGGGAWGDDDDLGMDDDEFKDADGGGEGDGDGGDGGRFKSIWRSLRFESHLVRFGTV